MRQFISRKFLFKRLFGISAKKKYGQLERRKISNCKQILQNIVYNNHYLNKMYIKTIIIDGFKSYAQRTEVTGFDPQFNAITGLNGSGKSNILDSICFLLGISNLTQVLVLSTYRSASLIHALIAVIWHIHQLGTNRNADRRHYFGNWASAQLGLIY